MHHTDTRVRLMRRSCFTLVLLTIAWGTLPSPAAFSIVPQNRNEQVARHLFAWGSEHDEQCAGWGEFGPKPMSKWPTNTPVNRTSSFRTSLRSGGESYLVPDGYAVTVVHAPAAVAPMVR